MESDNTFDSSSDNSENELKIEDDDKHIIDIQRNVEEGVLEESKALLRSTAAKTSQRIFDQIVRNCSHGLHHFDIVSTVGTSEEYLLDGFALFNWSILSFTGPDNSNNSSNTVNIISLIFVSEKMIKSFIDLGCKINLVFFQDNFNLHPASPTIQQLQARQYQMHFLSLSLPLLHVVFLPSWSSPHFDAFARESNIGNLISDETIDVYSQALVLHSHLVHDMIFFSLGHHRTEIVGGRVFAFSISFRKDKPLLHDLVDEFFKLLPPSSPSSSSSFLSCNYDPSPQARQTAIINICWNALSHTSKLSSSSSSDSASIMQRFALYAASVSVLSLDQKAAIVSSFTSVSPATKTLLNEYAKQLLLFSASSTSPIIISPISLEFFDMRLFALIVQMNHTPATLLPNVPHLEQEAKAFLSHFKITPQPPSSSTSTAPLLSTSPLSASSVTRLLSPKEEGLLDEVLPQSLKDRFSPFVDKINSPTPPAAMLSTIPASVSSFSSSSGLSWDDDDFDANVTLDSTIQVASCSSSSSTPSSIGDEPAFVDFMHWHRMDPFVSVDKHHGESTGYIQMKIQSPQCQFFAKRPNGVKDMCNSGQECRFNYIKNWPRGPIYCQAHKVGRMIDVTTQNSKLEYTMFMEQRESAALTKYIESLTDATRTVFIPSDGIKVDPSVKTEAARRLEENLYHSPTKHVHSSASKQPALTSAAAPKMKKHASTAQTIIVNNTMRLLSEDFSRNANKYASFSSVAPPRLDELFDLGSQLAHEAFDDDYLLSRIGNLGGNPETILAALKQHANFDKYQRDLVDLAKRCLNEVRNFEIKNLGLSGNVDRTLKCLKMLLSLSSHITSAELVILTNNLTTITAHMNFSSFVRLQLTKYGAQLTRPSGTTDERVRGFKPDPWQRKVLDVIDAEQSALVIAPTSSGKTFISLYAMEMVMRRYPADGIAVFICPTKALANQMRAEVDARFHNMKCSIFTRDFRYEPLGDKAKVLITVPACIEILMLTLYKLSWIERIKCYIFDEVHMISHEESGSTWQRLLMTVRAPIVALSATVGEAQRFAEWLSQVEANRDVPRTLHLIQHQSRYNNLRLLVCDGGMGTSTSTTNTPQKEFAPFNPIIFLTAEGLKKNGFPLDLKLLPENLVEVYDALVECNVANIHHLSPEAFFENNAAAKFLTMADADFYESELKFFLVNLSTFDLGRVIDAIIKNDRGNAVFEKMVVAPEYPYPPWAAMSEVAEALKKADMLPALCFTNDQAFIEESGRSVYEQLTKAETVWRESTITNLGGVKMTVKERMNYLKESVMNLMHTLADMERRTLTEDAQEDMLQLRREIEEGKAEWLRLSSVQEQYSFRGRMGLITRHFLEEEVPMKFLNEHPQWWKLLLRGIGIHHSSLPTKYRQVVERLLRQQYLGIVFTTATLATGINVPCKTALLAYDSVFLTSLSWRQMAGRAGRRGFDNMGNVIFMGISATKARRLIVGRPSVLRGHQILTPSYAMRTFLRYEGERNYGDAKYYKEVVGKAGLLPLVKNLKIMIKSPVSNSFSKDNAQDFSMELLFMQDFLLREGFLNWKGQPTADAGLVTHIFYTEPACLLFLKFIRNGLFKDIITFAPPGTDDLTLQRRILLVICHIFYQLPLAKSPSPSPTGLGSIQLPPLEPSFQECILQYRKDVLAKAVNYARLSFLSGKKQTLQEVLPLSRLSYRCDLAVTGEVVRSVFCRITGLDDTNYLNDDLFVMQLTQATYIDFNAGFLPRVIYQTGEVMLNAYAYDYYNHGSRGALIMENNIRKSDHYCLLSDFRLLLQAISVSLQRRLDLYSKTGNGRIDDSQIKLVEHVKAISNKFTARCRLGGLMRN